MDLQQLEYFRTVARIGNMTKAANDLHIAQPSLSVSIAKLEAELGVQLFDRVSGRIRLNQIGQRFYRQTDRIFLAVQDAQQEVADYSSHASKTVHLAVTSSDLCTGLFVSFMADHKDFRIHHFMHTEMNALSLLEEGQVDFVIATTPLYSPLIEWQTLIEERLVVLASQDNPLAKESLIQLERLKQQQFVVTRSAFHPDIEYAGFFREAQFQPEASFTTNEFETMVAMVELDVGIAIVSEETANKLLSNSKRRLTAVRMDMDYKGRTIGVARLKGHYFTRAVQEFFDYTVQYYKTERPSHIEPADKA
ncbi:MAG: LysR family transcriptional regulator [Oscillospiraceae bacterium]|nr:LysR family transcriptional regulator [Oscillospiraceae bacterium]